MDSSQRYPGQLFIKMVHFLIFVWFSSDNKKLHNLDKNDSLEPRYGQFFYRVGKWVFDEFII